MADEERYYTYEANEAGHLIVVDAQDQQLGSVTETEDGWRAYALDGAELAGGEVYATQHDAAAALDRARTQGDDQTDQPAD